MPHTPEIAIIEQNTLAALGLRTIIAANDYRRTDSRCGHPHVRFFRTTDRRHARYVCPLLRIGANLFRTYGFFLRTKAENHRAFLRRTASTERCAYIRLHLAPRPVDKNHCQPTPLRTQTERTSRCIQHRARPLAPRNRSIGIGNQRIY